MKWLNFRIAASTRQRNGTSLSQWNPGLLVSEFKPASFNASLPLVRGPFPDACLALADQLYAS
jgi:hypothetical protein